MGHARHRRDRRRALAGQATVALGPDLACACPLHQRGDALGFRRAAGGHADELSRDGTQGAVDAGAREGHRPRDHHLERLCGARGRRLAVWPVRHPGRDVCTRRAALPHLRCRAAGSGAQLRRSRARKPRPPALARRSGGGNGSHPGGRGGTMKGNVVKLARAGSLIVLLASAAGAGAEVYDLPPPGTDVIGAVTTVEARAADTLLDIGRRHGVGYEEIVRANPDVDVWLPGEGTRVVLPPRYILPPGPRRGVVL